MKLTPLADNVLLKHMEAEEKTASGIILSTATKEKSVIAEVIAAGPGTDDVKVTVKKGDKVITGKFAGQRERWPAVWGSTYGFSDRAAGRSGGRDEKVPDGTARKSAPYG